MIKITVHYVTDIFVHNLQSYMLTIQSTGTVQVVCGLLDSDTLQSSADRA
jgi:hypothetical protein